MKKLLSLMLVLATLASLLSFPTAATTAIPGDVNGDGNLSIQDVSLLLTSLESGKLGAASAIVADVNGDKVASIQDVSSLLSYLTDDETPAAITIPRGVVDLEAAPITPAAPILDGSLPASGALKLKTEGAASIPATFFRSPTLVRDGKIALLFDGTSAETGLNIDGSTEITYRITTSSGSLIQSGKAATDLTTFPELQCGSGLLGVSVPCDHAFARNERLYINLSFKDKNGASFSLTGGEIYYGLQYFGITDYLFDFTDENISTRMSKTAVTQTAKINGVTFTLVINLSKWAGNTKPSQIVTCAHLFWYCYPRMYFRFGQSVGASRSVTLAIENEGYGIASTGGSQVHIHDQWLADNKNDYDCLTHEFAHVIQNGWDGNYCEYSGYIERFADYCRFVYAYNDGYYNDLDWEMQTSRSESTLETSVRLLAWLDYNYSTPEIDIVYRWYRACYDKRYRADNWDAAWAEITAGTPVEGLNGQSLLAMYKRDTSFATLSTKSKTLGGTSSLNNMYNVREILRDRLV